MKQIGTDVLTVACGLALLLASCSSSEVTMPEFRKLPSFKGRVTKVEQIPYAQGHHLHSASGPDFRVTVMRQDGSTVIIKRIHTQIAGDPLKNLASRSVCDLPDEITACEDRIGKESY